MADYLSDPSSEHPPSSSLQSERGSQTYQQHKLILQKLEKLKEIAGKSKGRHERHTIFERSQFYGLLLGLLPDILLLREDGWSQIRLIPQDAMFRSTFEGVRDLRLRWALWQEDAFQLNTEAGSWASTLEFKRSTLCGVVLRKLSDIRHALKAITSELSLNCRGSQTAKVDTYLTPEFSCTAKCVEDMSPAIADLFDILPVLKEYDSASSGSELATFRGHLLSIKQSVLQDSVKLERKSMQQQSISVQDEVGFPVREQDDRHSYVPPWSYRQTLEETMLEDLEACLRIWGGIEDYENMKTENRKNRKGYHISMRDDIQESRMDIDEESSVAIAEQPSVTAVEESTVTTAEDGQTHKGVARLYEHYTFTRRENWRVADRVKIGESQEESRAVVAKGKKNTPVVEIMKNMSPDCRVHIDRLLDEKNLAERGKYYHWYCVFISSPAERDIFIDGKRIHQYMQLEVVIARHILPGRVKPTSPESSKPFLGKVSDISEPLKPKEKSRETLESNKLYFEERLESSPPNQHKRESTEIRRDDKSLEEMTVRLLRRLDERFKETCKDDKSLKETTVSLLRCLDERYRETCRDDESLREMRVRLLRHRTERIKKTPKDDGSLKETCKNDETLEDTSVHSLRRLDERFQETRRNDESLEETTARLLRRLDKRFKETHKDESLEELKSRLLRRLDERSKEPDRDDKSLEEMTIRLLRHLERFQETSRENESFFEEMGSRSLRQLKESAAETPSEQRPTR